MYVQYVCIGIIVERKKKDRKYLCKICMYVCKGKQEGRQIIDG